MKFTGERLILGEASKDIKEEYSLSINKVEHLARYFWAKKRVKGKVLDASCGSGYGTEILNAHGIDCSRESIEYAKKNYKGAFSLCDLSNDFPKGNFDTIVSFETIEHLKNPDYFLNNVKKNCSLFIFSVPLDRPSEFHETVYTIEDTKYFERIFGKIEWYEQNIQAIEKVSNNPRFIIGLTNIK